MKLIENIKDKLINFRYDLYRIKHKIRCFKTWIVNSYQRVRYGIGNDDAYDLHYHLAKIISHSLKTMFLSRCGVPMSLIQELAKKENTNSFDYDTRDARKEWDRILTEIIEGFEAFMKLDDEYITNNDYEKLLHDKFLHGLELFKKYYENLWI